MRRIVPILAICACSPTVRVYSEQPEAGPLAHDAAKLLGVRMKIVPQPGNGITTLEIKGTELDVETGKQICGRSLEEVLGAESVRDALTGGIVNCEPKAWSCATVTFVAHELGHVYGLPHVKQGDDKTETGNVMQPAPGKSRVLTDKQRTIVYLHALGLQEVCRKAE